MSHQADTACLPLHRPVARHSPSGLLLGLSENTNPLPLSGAAELVVEVVVVVVGAAKKCENDDQDGEDRGLTLSGGGGSPLWPDRPGQEPAGGGEALQGEAPHLHQVPVQRDDGEGGAHQPDLRQAREVRLVVDSPLRVVASTVSAPDTEHEKC